MSASRILLVAVALAVLGACPGGAAAASLVPPGNSAANQYTETFPTAGGNAEAKGKGKVTAGDVLGAGNAKKLDSKGKQGREAAAVVAATAPPAATGSADATGGSSVKGGNGDGPGGSGSHDQAGGGGDSSATGGSSGGSGGDSVAAEASGSSGFDEVLGQATGSTSSGGTGLLLPLIVLASAIWAVAFFLRRKRRTA